MASLELVAISLEQLATCSAELEDCVPTSEPESPVALEELLVGISGSHCSGVSMLEEESEEQAAMVKMVPAHRMKCLKRSKNMAKFLKNRHFV